MSRPPAARAAIIGTGFAGVQHAEALRRIGVEVTLLAASQEAHAEAAAMALGVGRWTADWATAAQDPDVDVVHVCVPNDLHCTVVMAALGADKHVICEKPLGTDLAQARQLADAARHSDRVTVLCHTYRFFAMAAELRERIASGVLGSLHAIRGSYLQDWLLSPRSTNWRVDAARGGRSRAIADIGSHWIDLAETVSRLRVVSVLADLSTVYARRPAHDDVRTFSEAGPASGSVVVTTEDQAGLLLRFENGVHGTLAVSQVAAGHGNDLELSVDGAEGSATWRQERPDELWLATGTGTQTIARAPGRLTGGAQQLARLPSGHNEGWADALRNLLAAAYATIDGSRGPLDEEAAPLPTFDDGLRRVALVEAALRSAADERWVELAEILAHERSMEEIV